MLGLQTTHGGCISCKPQRPERPAANPSLPPLPFPTRRLLLVNKLLHNIIQRIIPPRNKQHIIRRDRRATSMLREILEVLRHAFCVLVSAIPFFA